MGVPLAASSRQQATGVRAAELSSVGLACTLAAHTKLLLQQLGFDKPISLRVLTGGLLAMQLGLSKHHRHVQLDSCFGQFQLSKVQVHQDFAAMLTYNPPASELHWLLPKLKMHIKTAEARALSTVLCEREAFFLGSPCSFYIGVVSLTPIMAQLDLAQLERTVFEQLTLTAYATQLDLAQLERIDLDQLERDQLERIGLDPLERIALEELPQSAYASQLWGKEPEKPIKIPELQSLQRKELAKMTAKSLAKIELERTALHMSFHSFLQNSLREEKLTAEGACTQCFTTQPDEGQTALASRGAAWVSQLLGKELVIHLAFPEGSLDSISSLASVQEQLSLSGGASGALAASSSSSSIKPPRRTLHSFSSILLSIFLILMVSIFPSNIFDSNFIHCCAFQLVEQDELSTTFGQKELGKKNEFHTTFLWDQELEELLVDKPFPLDPPYDHLGKENLWSVQLQQNLLENDEQKELADQELEEKNFDKSFQKMIFLKKLVALMPEKHFALAASSRLLGNEAWEEHREASKEIRFDKKKGDKELPHQLRRLRALCPTSFEESSFTRTSLTRSSLTKSSLTTSSLTRNSFTRSSLTSTSFTKKQLDKNQLDKKQLDKEQLDNKQLDKKQLHKKQLDKHQLHKKQLDKNQLDKKQLDREQFDNKQLDKKQLDKEQLDNKQLDKKQLHREQLLREQFLREQLLREQLLREQLLHQPRPGNNLSRSKLPGRELYSQQLDRRELLQHQLGRRHLLKEQLRKEQFRRQQLREEQLHPEQLRREPLYQEQLSKEQLKGEQP